ncbi:hypothetical protein D3C87_1150550 [compost metagenome]
MKRIFSLLLLFLSPLAQADEFYPYHWTPGLHLFAGGGINTAVYSNQQDTYDGGVGLNLKTDLVYFLNENWAIEAGSSIKFNRVSGYLLWDTLFTVGVRTTLPSLLNYEYGQPYGRIFVGRAPTVMFLNGNDSPTGTEDKDVSRIQFDGPVGGLAIGTFHTTESGLVWFTELGGSIQSLEQESAIKMDGEVPVVVSNKGVSDHTTILSLYLTVGILAF